MHGKRIKIRPINITSSFIKNLGGSKTMARFVFCLRRYYNNLMLFYTLVKRDIGYSIGMNYKLL